MADRICNISTLSLVDIVLFGFSLSGFSSRFLKRVYKECFVPVSNWCGISQSTPTGVMMSHIGWGGEQNTIYKSVETFPYQTRFKALREARKGKLKEDNIC